MSKNNCLFQGRTALVTGASRGIGRAIALELARRGAHIIAIARTVSGLEALDDDIASLGGHVTLVPLNLKDGAAIDRLGASLYERWGSLDILVANAGILGILSPLGHIPPEVWNDALNINVTANWRLLRALDPLLQKSAAGRVLFISSAAAEKCTAYWGAYSVSKAALNALAFTYHKEVATTPICVTIVDPGPIHTDMRRAAMPGEDPETLNTPEMLAPSLLKFLMPTWDKSGYIYRFQYDALESVLTVSKGN
jgi:NAD(P)-dependent dehydrogenase (short-subunit alcohol dehydrogenase family)